jgi:hypothetical protein
MKKMENKLGCEYAIIAGNLASVADISPLTRKRLLRDFGKIPTSRRVGNPLPNVIPSTRLMCLCRD